MLTFVGVTFTALGEGYPSVNGFSSFLYSFRFFEENLDLTFDVCVSDH